MGTKAKKAWIFAGVAAGAFAVWLAFFPPLEFSLNGEERMQIDAGESFEDPGAKLVLFGIDLSDRVKVEGAVDTEQDGTYDVLYSYRWGAKEGMLRRRVVVVERPEITVHADGVILCEVGTEPELPLVTAYDEKDGDITDRIQIEGPYNQTFGYKFAVARVENSRGAEDIRVIPFAMVDEEITVQEDVLPEGVFDMEVKDGVWSFFGYMEESGSGPLQAHLAGENPLEGEVEEISPYQRGYYQVSFDLSQIAEGEYTLEMGQQEMVRPVIQYISTSMKLGRMRIGDHLVTWSYDGGICLRVEPFAYDYDLVIDVGHGGSDTGMITVNGDAERDINLEVALYEKERYESMGVSVWLNRQTEDYKVMMGEEDWENLTRMSWTLGWYGAVSRYAYSIHHNAGEELFGPEIIVDSWPTKEELAVEYTICDAFEEVFPKITTKWRIFTRDYVTGERIDRSDGKAYPDVVTYYANMRIPYVSFGTIVSTYENSYLNNWENYDWYWMEGNWKQVSEARIKAYVEALGKTYVPPQE